MECKSCNHTMQMVNSSPKIFWCRRCGSLFDSDVPTNHCEPYILERIRQFLDDLPDNYSGELHRLGIVEALYHSVDGPT